MPDTLIYYREYKGEESNVFNMTFPDGPDIFEFKKLCIIMAQELGYDLENIQEAFGSTCSLQTFHDLNLLEYKK